MSITDFQEGPSQPLTIEPVKDSFAAHHLEEMSWMADSLEGYKQICFLPNSVGNTTCKFPPSTAGITITQSKDMRDPPRCHSLNAEW